MDEVLVFLCVASIVLAVVTVVGHVLWVAIAWIFRTFSGEAVANQTPQGKPCASCGARFGVKGGRCVVCGAVSNVSPAATQRDELTTTARQLRRLLDKNAITDEHYHALTAAIATELARHGAALPPLAGSKPAPGELWSEQFTGQSPEPVWSRLK